MIYQNLALEGGGVLGIAHAGALKVLEKAGLLDKITCFAGSSAGALVAGMIACRIPIDVVTQTVMSLDMDNITDRSCALVDFYRVITQYGLYKGDYLFCLYAQILDTHIGDSKITFAQVRERFGTTLIIVGTSLNTQGSVYFSPDSHPDMSINLAVRISMSIPMMFKVIRYAGDIFVDGGVLDNYPIHYFDRKGFTGPTIGLKLVTDKEIEGTYDPVVSPVSYIKALTSAISNQATKYHVKEEDWSRTVQINTGSVSAFDFSIDLQKKQDLFNRGEKAMNEYLTKT